MRTWSDIGELGLGSNKPFTGEQAIDAVVRSPNRTLLLVSGGEQQGDEAMLEKAQRAMEAGATGLIFGRNVWQRDHDESLAFVARLQEILAKYVTPRPPCYDSASFARRR